MGAIQSSADLKIERLFYPSLTGSFLFYLIIFYFANCYYTLNAYFYFPNWRQEGGLSGWGVGWEDQLAQDAQAVHDRDGAGLLSVSFGFPDTPYYPCCFFTSLGVSIWPTPDILGWNS